VDLLVLLVRLVPQDQQELLVERVPRVLQVVLVRLVLLDRQVLLVLLDQMAQQVLLALRVVQERLVRQAPLALQVLRELVALWVITERFLTLLIKLDQLQRKSLQSLKPLHQMGLFCQELDRLSFPHLELTN
jgi:hypothetical protein